MDRPGKTISKDIVFNVLVAQGLKFAGNVTETKACILCPEPLISLGPTELQSYWNDWGKEAML